MRILVVTNYYPPHYFGGYELKCAQVVSHLRERGHDVFVLAGNHASPGIPTGDEPGIRRTLRYDTPETPFFARLAIERDNWRETAGRIRDFGPDVIYLWNQRDITLGPSQAACDSGVPKIYQIGDFWPNTYIKPGRKAMLRGWLRNCIPYGVRTHPELSPAIVVGGWMAGEMADRFGSKTVHHVPHGTLLPPVPDFAKLTSATPKFIFAGRIDPEKGLDVAIRAFAMLRDAGTVADFEFSILGGGEETYLSSCRRLVAQHGLSGEIRFLGKTNEMNRYYADHAVLLMPTLMREPFGLVVIEAMSHGLVPVVSDAYGPGETVRHLEDGLRFKPGDASDLAEKIRCLLDDPSLRLRLGTAARAAAEDRFRIDREMDRIEGILLATANGNPTLHPQS